MIARLDRSAPLTGLAFAVLSLLVIAITPSSPKASTDGTKVIAFYAKHHSTERLSILIAMLAFAFFLTFAALLSNRLRPENRSTALSFLSIAGAIVFTVGFTINAGFSFALANDGSHLTAASAQTLNTLDEDVFFAIAGGIGLFGIAVGLAILQHAPLPKWLGWSALVIALASFTPLFGIALDRTQLDGGGEQKAALCLAAGSHLRDRLDEAAAGGGDLRQRALEAGARDPGAPVPLVDEDAGDPPVGRRWWIL